MFRNLCFCLASLFCLDVFAHALPQNNALISVHGGRVEVSIDINIGPWLTALNDPQAWLMGDTEAVVSDKLKESQKLQQLNQLLLKHVKLKHSDIVIPLTNKALPKRIAHEHQRFVYQGMLSGGQSGKVTAELNVQFPKSLGDVYLKIVQPEFVNVKAGKPTRIKLN